MTRLVFVKKEDKKGIFKDPRKTNYFLPKRRTCPPKRGRMVTLAFSMFTSEVINNRSRSGVGPGVWRLQPESEQEQEL